jgi:hypothetical protein
MTIALLERSPLAPQSARNADLNDLTTLLQQQRSQVVDLVLPSSLIRMRNGMLEIAGADPILRDDGVLDPNGAYRLTSIADAQLGDKFGIPVKYMRKMRDDSPLGTYLLDQNINTWADHPANAEMKVLARLFWANDEQHPEAVGVARAFLSNRYGARDNFDTLVSILAGIREAGLAADDLELHGDITDRKFYVVVNAPEIQGYAHSLIENYRSPYRNAGHGGDDAVNLPIVSAGLIISNSEIGYGSQSVTPRLTIRACSNGLQVTKDAIAFRHSGSRLEEGAVDWAVDTRAAANEVARLQVRDAVSQFLTADYVQKTVEELERDAATPIAPGDVTQVIEAVATEFNYTEDEANDILGYFITGGQMAAAGVMNAVTAAVQKYPNADRAYEVEATAIPAMAFAAKVAANA